MNERICCKLTLGELAAMTFVFLVATDLVISGVGLFSDYAIYVNASKGNMDDYFYAYWLLPFLKIFAILPFPASYFLWITLSILGVWFAARVFDGKSVGALLSYQLPYVLFWGQISGIICGFLALFWWAMHQKKWFLAGLALLIAAAKPQTGGMFAFFLFILADIPWREKIHALFVPCVGFLLSLIFYPGWIGDLFSRRGSPIAFSNVSLWQWIGPWGLLLLIPAIVIPMDRQRRFLALTTACILSIPYFLQADLLTLYIFPTGILSVLLGYVPGVMLQFFSYAGQPSGVIVPLVIYDSQIYKAVKQMRNVEAERIYSKKNFGRL
jgi:hypothetical protein